MVCWTLTYITKVAAQGDQRVGLRLSMESPGGISLSGGTTVASTSNMSEHDTVVTSTPPGPRFPIRDVQVDLIDRLTPSVEDEELLSLKLDENEIVVLNIDKFVPFPNLRKVSVCYNHIKRIDMFQWFTNLRELHLQETC